MQNKTIDLDAGIGVLPFSAEPGHAPLSEATGPTLAAIAASADRLIAMQMVLAQHLERLDSRLDSIHKEMQSNMNAYLGWTQEFARRTKA